MKSLVSHFYCNIYTSMIERSTRIANQPIKEQSVIAIELFYVTLWVIAMASRLALAETTGTTV